MKKRVLNSKTSQITIFVIVAIIIVASIVLVFSISSRPGAGISVDNPVSISKYISQCSGAALIGAEKELIKHSGFLDYGSNYMMFNGSKVVFLCYTQEELCINNHPMLVSEMQKQIALYVTPKMEKCFEDVKNRLSKYDYKEEPMTLSIIIKPKNIIININKTIVYTYNEQTKRLEIFPNSINSPMFEFAQLTSDIIGQEVTCDCSNEACNADIRLLNLYNREFRVDKPILNYLHEEVYSITEKASEKRFDFAVKNCWRDYNT
jgi:hypothetical protein